MNWDHSTVLTHNEFIPWAPWNARPDRSKVALVTTAGVYLKKGLHHPFQAGDSSFREFPSVAQNEDMELAQSAYEQRYGREDINVLFPLERLSDLAASGYIGAVAPFAYSFYGATSDLIPLLANYAPSVAYRMKRMGAEVALVLATGEVEHQIAALVARAIELAGVPTVVLGNNPAVLQAVGTPRAVVVQHPDGAPLGNPGNAGKHQVLIREALDEAWQLEGPGQVAKLAYNWQGR